MTTYISIDPDFEDHHWWNELLRIYAKAGATFEIHCWYDEMNHIQQIEHFGVRTRNPLPEVIAISGEVTKELVDALISGHKPERNSGYNKMTQFYMVRIGDQFSSEQYGTSLILGYETLEESQQVEAVLSRIDHHATIYRNA